MKSMRFIVPALVAVCLLVATLAWGQSGSVEQQITALSDQAVLAYLQADTSFIEKYYADDATVIHSDGKLSTKAQEIQNLKSGALKYASIDVQERKIRIHGDTVVTVALSSPKGTLNGKQFSGDYLSTRIWVKQTGNWKVVAFQATRMAPASKRSSDWLLAVTLTRFRRNRLGRLWIGDDSAQVQTTGALRRIKR
jgi:ketosteroid isomerase-like protein